MPKEATWGLIWPCGFVGLRFNVSGLGSRVWGLGFRAWYSRFTVLEWSCSAIRETREIMLRNGNLGNNTVDQMPHTDSQFQAKGFPLQLVQPSVNHKNPKP